jgi:predicted transcriptional regulator
MSKSNIVMARTPQNVTDAELAVLQALWDHGGTATVRQLADALYPRCTTAQYATVQKLLERLEAKGCVTRDRSPWPHQFTAAIDRDDLIGRHLRSVAEKLCGGSLTPLLTHLLRAERLSAKDRQELRAFMEELEQKAKSKGKT